MTKSDAAVWSEWSPCSRYFGCATLFHRVKVDNNVKIYSIDGTLAYEQPCPDELYQVREKNSIIECRPPRSP
eukprot:SAG22_NODE_48_length_24654_cov_4.406394_5_plen_72_part_00